jgi:drug/metabolite transporter (DMT)-like permease
MGWVSPTFITLAVLFEPVGASFLGYLFFGEAPSLIILLGIVILLIGVAVAALGSPQK